MVIHMSDLKDYPLRRAILDAIEDRGIGAAELSRRAGIHRQQLWRYKRGMCDLLAENADRLRVVLGLIIVDPLGEETED